MKIYGIKNCDTMKKAIKWLTENGVEAEFHDYKKAGLSPVLADEFISNIDISILINARGTTFRQLGDDDKALIKDDKDPATAKRLMMDNPSVIKRPILEHNGQYLIGFKADEYQEFINNYLT
ncbi:MAG: Spx/MgsR family transcriptional regulator [Bermanella sp.]|jgi:Spx/MgsR family transcriptional regulator